MAASDRSDVRCLPLSFGWGDRGGLYADASCGAPAAVAQESCGGRHRALPYVLFADAGGLVTEVRRGGARLQPLFQQVGAGGCAAAQREEVGFAIGEPVALDEFLPAELSQLAGPSGLVQTTAEVTTSEGALSVARFDQLATNALGGYECTLATTPDEVLRCVPAIALLAADYADRACTQAIWQTGSEAVSIGIEPAAPAAHTSHGVALPRIERVLFDASPHEGPVYARRGTECTLVPGVPNARQPYRRFAREAPLSDLPALSIVIR